MDMYVRWMVGIKSSETEGAQMPLGYFRIPTYIQMIGIDITLYYLYLSVEFILTN